MCININAYVSKCVKCAKLKGAVPLPAVMLECSPSDRPWNVVSIYLLQLPASHQGSKYLLVYVDRLSRYIVRTHLKDKWVKSVAHAIVTDLFCGYTAPRVLLSDNGTEFRSHLLDEIRKQYGVKHGFTVSYYCLSNGLVERVNRKIMEVLRPVIGELLETWGDYQKLLHKYYSSVSLRDSPLNSYFFFLSKRDSYRHC